MNILKSIFNIICISLVRFCKQVMKLLEASGEEVNDQLYDCLQRDLLSPRDGRYFKSYFVGDLAISLIETKQIIRLSIYKKLMLVLMPPPLS